MSLGALGPTLVVAHVVRPEPAVESPNGLALRTRNPQRREWGPRHLARPAVSILSSPPSKIMQLDLKRVRRGSGDGDFMHVAYSRGGPVWEVVAPARKPHHSQGKWANSRWRVVRLVKIAGATLSPAPPAQWAEASPRLATLPFRL